MADLGECASIAPQHGHDHLDPVVDKLLSMIFTAFYSECLFRCMISCIAETLHTNCFKIVCCYYSQ